MSSRAPAATAVPRGSEGGAGGTDHLWAKAAELERDFTGYKRRLAERRAQAAAEVAGGRAEEEERRGDGDDAAGRGRRYEEYVRKRDERLRQEWRARMERKEAEVQALWARLDRTSSRGRRGGDGELVAASHAKEDHGNLQQKPVNLEVKVKPTAPVTPRCSPATKLSRPRTGVPPSPVAASPRLSTPDPRRRPSHLHREQPPATPRKENRMPPSCTSAVAAPATPRPRTMLSRSRSLYKDRGYSSVAIRESPRPPRLQPPRSSYDSASDNKELPLHADAISVSQSNFCSSEQGVLADLKKASAVAPESFRLRRSSNAIVPMSPPQVIPRDEPDSSEIAPAGDGNADNKSNDEHVDRSSDKLGSVEITGDSDTEPSYVYIKKDSDEQTPRSCQASAGLGTCTGVEARSDKKDSDNVDDAMESTGSNEISGRETPVTDAEEASRRESCESLYSNVQSSFSPRSELDTSATDSALPSATEQSPESDASPRPRKNTEVEDAEKSLPIPTTPRSIAQSPMDAVTGLKRFLTFSKKNGKGSEAAAAIVERTQRSMAPAPPPGDGCMSGEWPAGDSVKARLDCSDVASADDLDNSYVISPHGNSSGLSASHRSIKHIRFG
ncbi:hypothetical protein BAE44_0008194 [Dichanthelium oligosanthes]|uniref:Uncharacterized protein n=1 Tax=Dichanthelium oligosanthes TaxID=888268 RepID=A0A1E5W071_9POAL|nr:hypothetical protein BAE44_0008194 [Dichanthelium oligosanthes]